MRASQRKEEMLQCIHFSLAENLCVRERECALVVFVDVEKVLCPSKQTKRIRILGTGKLT